MAPAFVAMMAVVDCRPGTTAQRLLTKPMQGVAQVLVTRPPLVAGPARWIAVGFAGATGHRGAAGQALQALRLAPETIPVVVADFGSEPRRQLGPGARQRPKQVMVGMTPEELLDALAVEPELLFDREEHLYQAQG
jgi:hypothetical protein